MRRVIYLGGCRDREAYAALFERGAYESEYAHDDLRDALAASAALYAAVMQETERSGRAVSDFERMALGDVKAVLGCFLPERSN